MTAGNPPARLFVLLARTQPMGLILRRGPSNWVKLIHWDTKTDTFRDGQWFHGRIFEHRCDLSPNGKWFVYNAFKQSNRKKNPEIGEQWTALSKPPLFTAVGLWVLWNGWGGGGYFYDNHRMLLNHLDDNKTLHSDFRLPKDLDVKSIDTFEDEYDYMSNNIHLNVMLRDGWTISPSSPQFHLHSGDTSEPEPAKDLALVLEKVNRDVSLFCQIFQRHDDNSISLVRSTKQVISKTRDWAHFQLKISKKQRSMKIHPSFWSLSWKYQYGAKIGDVESDLGGVTWADFDQRHRLVLAKDGKLFSAVGENSELVLTELGDFNEADYPKKS